MTENRCVMCGDIIPEGRQVCKMCEIKCPNVEIKDDEFKSFEVENT